MPLDLRPLRLDPPAAVPVSLGEIKAHCRVDHDDDDQLLEALTASAVDLLDGWSGIMGRCLIEQRWGVKLACWPSFFLQLPFPDCRQIEVTYIDGDLVERPLSDGLFHAVEGVSGTVLEWAEDLGSPGVASRADAIRVEMLVGYGPEPESVPASIRLAIKMLVALWYGTREAAHVESFTDLPFGVRALLAPHRRVSL